DLARGSDDARTADQRLALFDSSLCRRGDPDRILIRARLHGQMVVEHPQMIELRRLVQNRRRVVADEHYLCAAEATHAVGLRPAAIVAERHSDTGSMEIEDGKAEIAGLEIETLEMDRRTDLRLSRTGQVDLAIAADEVTVLADEVHGVEASHGVTLALPF